MCAFIPVMIAATAVSLAATGASTYMGIRSAKRQAAAQAAMYGQQAAQDEQNAKWAKEAATDAERQGEEDVVPIEAQGTKLRSTQRTIYAANGIDPTSGSAVDVQAGTEMLTQLDVDNTRRNAALTARGYRQQGINYQGQAAVSRSGAANSMAAGREAVVGSIIGGIGSAAGTLASGASTVYGAGGFGRKRLTA